MKHFMQHRVVSCQRLDCFLNIDEFHHSSPEKGLSQLGNAISLFSFCMQTVQFRLRFDVQLL